ncbi:uncharacterized protein LOC122262887 [Penaeus japonicus]|uniref:uncharacterized protein LOC122262887 n=1 Tax=Penaeus japonicus TaxID=27405 RepID=UPI001C712E6E|nr:uncharacterized protein LOC122262887 [Penaeus japonicus]
MEAQVAIGVTTETNEMSLTHLTFSDPGVAVIGDPVSPTGHQCDLGYFVSNIACSMADLTCVKLGDTHGDCEPGPINGICPSNKFMTGYTIDKNKIISINCCWIGS